VAGVLQTRYQNAADVSLMTGHENAHWSPTQTESHSDKDRPLVATARTPRDSRYCTETRHPDTLGGR
jgi:hypothetical protein